MGVFGWDILERWRLIGFGYINRSSNMYIVLYMLVFKAAFIWWHAMRWENQGDGAISR